MEVWNNEIKELFFLSLNYEHACVSLGGYENINAGIHKGKKRVSGALDWSCGRGSCDLLDMGSGRFKTQVLWKNNKHS